MRVEFFKSFAPFIRQQQQEVRFWSKDVFFYSALPEVFNPIETILVLNQLKSERNSFISGYFESRPNFGNVGASGRCNYL